MSEFAIFYYMPKGPKNGFKKPKNEEINLIYKYLKNKQWKQCLMVKNMSSMSFIHPLYKIGEFFAKNAKLQYANEIKVQIFEK